MKADKILFAIATTLITACGSGQKNETTESKPQLDTSVTTPGSDTASTRTRSLSGSSGNGTLTDTGDVNKTPRQNTTKAGTASNRTRSLSGSSGNGTLTDTANVNKQKASRQKTQ